MTEKKKSDIIQIYNPKTKRYITINRTIGKLLDLKKTDCPYKAFPLLDMGLGLGETLKVYGITIDEFARCGNVPSETVRRWMKLDPECHLSRLNLEIAALYFLERCQIL